MEILPKLKDELPTYKESEQDYPVEKIPPVMFLSKGGIERLINDHKTWLIKRMGQEENIVIDRVKAIMWTNNVNRRCKFVLKYRNTKQQGDDDILNEINSKDGGGTISHGYCYGKSG
jgi:hypothetical protein